jgi:hypothetical protein
VIFFIFVSILQLRSDTLSQFRATHQNRRQKRKGVRNSFRDREAHTVQSRPGKRGRGVAFPLPLAVFF